MAQPDREKQPRYDYDVAISYPSEHRGFARRLASGLRSFGLSIYFDADQRAEDLGGNVKSRLEEIYRTRSRLCVVLLSRQYLAKRWTRFELACALRAQRARRRTGSEYVLPLKLDDSVVPALEQLSYMDLARELPRDPEVPLSVARTIARKLGAGSRRPSLADRARSVAVLLSQPAVVGYGVLATLVQWTIWGVVHNYIGNAADITWNRDFMGHWLIGLSIVVYFLFALSFERVRRRAGVDILFEAEDENIRGILSRLAGGLALAFVFTYANRDFVLNAQQTHWSVALGLGSWVPAVVAGSYYFLSVLPSLLLIRRYYLHLEIVSRRCTELPDFTRSSMRAFGLMPLGNVIGVPTLAAVCTLSLALWVQYGKGEFSFGSFAAIGPVVYLLWRICFKPLWLIYTTLDHERLMLKQEWDRLALAVEAGYRTTLNRDAPVTPTWERLDSARRELARVEAMTIVPVPRWVTTIGFGMILLVGAALALGP